MNNLKCKKYFDYEEIDEDIKEDKNHPISKNQKKIMQRQRLQRLRIAELNRKDVNYLFGKESIKVKKNNPEFLKLIQEYGKCSEFQAKEALTNAKGDLLKAINLALKI